MPERPPLGRRATILLAAVGALLVWGWVPLQEWLFQGRARDTMAAHAAAVLAAAFAAWIGGRRSGRYFQAFLVVLVGFAAMAILAAIVWYGFLLPAACDKGADC